MDAENTKDKEARMCEDFYERFAQMKATAGEDYPLHDMDLEEFAEMIIWDLCTEKGEFIGSPYYWMLKRASSSPEFLPMYVGAVIREMHAVSENPDIPPLSRAELHAAIRVPIEAFRKRYAAWTKPTATALWISTDVIQ